MSIIMLLTIVNKIVLTIGPGYMFMICLLEFPTAYKKKKAFLCFAYIALFLGGLTLFINSFRIL